MHKRTLAFLFLNNIGQNVTMGKFLGVIDKVDDELGIEYKQTERFYFKKEYRFCVRPMIQIIQM